MIRLDLNLEVDLDSEFRGCVCGKDCEVGNLCVELVDVVWRNLTRKLWLEAYVKCDLGRDVGRSWRDDIILNIGRHGLGKF